MTRIGFIADVHCGNHRGFGGDFKQGLNRRARLTVDALSLAYQEAESQGCEALVIAGDLFDTTRPIPQLLSAVQEALSGKMPVNILMGNHDQQSADPGDHALGPLHNYSGIQVVERAMPIRYGNTQILMIPYHPGEASLWVPTELGSLYDEAGHQSGGVQHRIVCLHAGLKDGQEPKFLADSHDAISAATLAQLCAPRGIGHVIAGNWHFKKKWSVRGVTMYQCGTLAPTGFDNPGLDGHGNLAIFDGKTGSWLSVEIPGPRFVTARTFDEGKKVLPTLQKAKENGNHPHLRWSVLKTEVDDALQSMVSYEGVEVEILVDSQESQAAAKKASTAARRAETLDDALSEYIRKMDLGEVNRDAVEQRCRTYLKR